MNQKTLLFNRSYISNPNFITLRVKFFKIPGFIVIFVRNTRFIFSKLLEFQVSPVFFFCLSSQIPGFSKI